MSSNPPSRVTTRASLFPLALAMVVCGLAATLPGGTGCSVREVSTTPEDQGDDSAVRSHLAHDVGVPMFQALAAEVVRFEQAMAALEAAPTAATVAAAQEGWRSLRAAWKRSRVLGFGPAKAIEARVDWPTTDAERVEEAIVGGAFDAASIQKLGTSVRGFITLEYLLFDPVGGEAAVLDAMIDSTERRGFARALAADLVSAFQEVAAAWDPAQGDYAGEIADAGDGSTAFPEGKAAVDALVNESIFVVEYVLGDELAKPLGLRNDGVPQPDLVIAARSDASLDDSIAQLESFQAVYTGAPPGGDTSQATGLSALVRARGSAELDADVRAATQRAFDALRAVPRPLTTAVTSNTPAVQHAYDEVRVLKNLLSTDVATKLGTTLSFNDNDGD